MTLQQGGVGGAPPPAAVVAPVVRTRENTEGRGSPRRLVSRILFLLTLGLATLVFVFPCLWLLSASLKTRSDVF